MVAKEAGVGLLSSAQLSSSLVRGFLFMGLHGCCFLGTLHRERVRGYHAPRTGCAFLPLTLIVAFWTMG